METGRLTGGCTALLGLNGLPTILRNTSTTSTRTVQILNGCPILLRNISTTSTRTNTVQILNGRPILLRNALPAHHLPINLEDHHQAYNQGDSSTIDNPGTVFQVETGRSPEEVG